jgi:hypothetical protein
MTKLFSVILTGSIAASLVVLGSGWQPSQLAIAQPVRTENVWRQVYEQLPDLPKENQYVSKTTGNVDPDNTLIARLIRYHVFVKGRPPNFRLDWKLTIADYLDANELMVEGVYPGADTLRQNPIESDRAAIQRLTRNQRNALIQVIVNIFNPNSEPPATPVSPTTLPPTPTPTPVRPSTPSLPQPGDAQRLKQLSVIS